MDARSNLGGCFATQEGWSSPRGCIGERDQCGRLDCIDRFREIEPLCVRAAKLTQPLDLFGCFDAFDDDALS
jgi:hypothetical protein